MKKFKIRCSAINKIGITSLTEKQYERLEILTNKDGLTEKQQTELHGLRHRLRNPKLTTGSKTYCKNWLKEQKEVFNRAKIIKSKYINKGNITEDNSIDFIAEQLGFGMLLKNEKHFSNDFIEGTPDIITKDLVIDAKNSWDHDTFPLFEDEIPEKDYSSQLQGYMCLTGRKKSKLAYVLSDTPINLIEKEAYYWCKDNGFDDLDVDIYKQFIRKMTYSDVPDHLKIKVFDLDYDQSYIDQVEKAVKLCRIYIKELIKKHL